VNPALEQAKESFHGIDVDSFLSFASRISAASVFDYIVFWVSFLNEVISGKIIRHNVGVVADVFAQNFFEVLSGDAPNVARDHFAVSLDKRDYRSLVAIHARPSSLPSFSALAADIRFIHFNRARQFGFERFLFHRVANPMRHEPRALISHSKHSVKLVGAHAFLARAEKMDCHEPFVQRNMAVREDRIHSDRELLAASLTLPHAFADRALGIGLTL